MSIETAVALVRICFQLAILCTGVSISVLLFLIIRGETKHYLYRRHVDQVRDRHLKELLKERRTWIEVVEKNPTLEVQLDQVYAAYKNQLNQQKNYIQSPEDTIIDGAL